MIEQQEEEYEIALMVEGEGSKRERAQKGLWFNDTPQAAAQEKKDRRAFITQLKKKRIKEPTTEAEFHAARFYSDKLKRFVLCPSASSSCRYFLIPSCVANSSIYDVEQWLDYIQLKLESDELVTVPPTAVPTHDYQNHSQQMDKARTEQEEIEYAMAMSASLQQKEEERQKQQELDE